MVSPASTPLWYQTKQDASVMLPRIRSVQMLSRSSRLESSGISSR